MIPNNCRCPVCGNEEMSAAGYLACECPSKTTENLTGLAHEIWATAQLMPGEGIAGGVARIEEVLRGKLKDDSELLTIAYMSGHHDELDRHRKTKEALSALLHYIDHAGTWPEGWDVERVREVAE